MTTERKEAVRADLDGHAARLRNRIAKIRIDFPEAADARRMELNDVYRQIARLRPLSQAGEQ